MADVEYEGVKEPDEGEEDRPWRLVIGTPPPDEREAALAELRALGWNTEVEEDDEDGEPDEGPPDVSVDWQQSVAIGLTSVGRERLTKYLGEPNSGAARWWVDPRGVHPLIGRLMEDGLVLDA